MDEYKPPFTITNSILSHVASVSEKVGRIRLLSGLKQNPYITQTDLAKELSLSRRTVQRIMKELMNDGKIKRVGSTRTGHWEIND